MVGIVLIAMKRNVSPVPAGLEPGTPFGNSVQTLATYLPNTHAR